MPIAVAAPREPMTIRRTHLALMAVLCGLASLGSAGLMAWRIASFHASHPRELFVFKRVLEPSFRWGGRLVTIAEDATPTSRPSQPPSGSASPGSGAAEIPMLALAFGDQTKRLPVAIPSATKIPDLARYEDWFKVFRMLPGGGMTGAQFDEKYAKGDLLERLLIVTRTPRPGADPRTWGSVWKSDWTFGFLELMPTGEIVDHGRLRYPKRGGVRPPAPDELHENTWQFQAALQLMPQAGAVGPTHQFYGNALSAAGWTLPGAIFFGLGFTLCAAFAAAPPRRRANV